MSEFWSPVGLRAAALRSSPPRTSIANHAVTILVRRLRLMVLPPKKSWKCEIPQSRAETNGMITLVLEEIAMNATSDFRTVYVLCFSLIGAVVGLAASWVLAVEPVTNLIA